MDGADEVVKRLAGRRLQCGRKDGYPVADGAFNLFGIWADALRGRENQHHHFGGVNGINDGLAVGGAATISRGAIQQRMPADSSLAQTALATVLSLSMADEYVEGQGKTPWALTVLRFRRAPTLHEESYIRVPSGSCRGWVRLTKSSRRAKAQTSFSAFAARLKSCLSSHRMIKNSLIEAPVSWSCQRCAIGAPSLSRTWFTSELAEAGAGFVQLIVLFGEAEAHQIFAAAGRKKADRQLRRRGGG